MPSRRRPCDRARERGAALAEFALTVSIMLLLLIGLCELGRGFTTYLSVVQGAREGARAAMTSGATDATISATATAAASPVSVSVTVSHTGAATTVTVNTSFTTIVPLLSAVWGGGPLPVSRTFTSQ